MNFSTPWNLDMSVDTIPDNQPILHAMIHTQRVMFLVLFVLGIYYCWRIANHSLMHFNFRLIMSTTAIYAILLSGSRILMYIVLGLTTDSGDRTMINYGCMFFGTLHSMSIIGLVCSMLMVGIERHIATVYVYGYESKNKHIGCIMVIVVLTIGLISSSLLNFTKLYRFFDMPTTYQTCIVVELYPEHALGSFSLGILGCLLSALWQFQLFRQNQIASKSQIGIDSLAVRFQQIENVHTTRLIFPVLIVYMIMCSLGLIMSTTRYCLMRNGELATAKIIMQAGYMLIDGFCIFCMTFVLFFHPGLRFNLKRDVCKLLRIKVDETKERNRRRVMDVPDEGALYFQQLNQYWK